MRRSPKLLAVLAIGVIVLGAVPIVVRNHADRRAGLDDPPSVVRVQDSIGIVFQRGDLDCGIAALTMLLQRRDVSVSYEQLATSVEVTARGVSLKTLAELAERYDVELKGYYFSALDSRLDGTPWIGRIGYGGFGHYVVVEQVGSRRVVVLDPKVGRVSYDRVRFEQVWSGHVLSPWPMPTAQPAESADGGEGWGQAGDTLGRTSP